MNTSTVSADRERALLEACLALLAEEGYEGLTMDAVAARARASKATIYRRWSGKREMVVAAVSSIRAAREVTTPDTGTLRGDLQANCRTFAQTLDGLDGRLILGLLQSKLTDPELCNELEGVLPSGARTDPASIRRAVDRGELTHEIDVGLIDELVGALLISRMIFDRPMNDDYIVHLVDDVLLPAIRNAAAAHAAVGERRMTPKSQGRPSRDP